MTVHFTDRAQPRVGKLLVKGHIALSNEIIIKSLSTQSPHYDLVYWREERVLKGSCFYLIR